MKKSQNIYKIFIYSGVFGRILTDFKREIAFFEKLMLQKRKEKRGGGLEMLGKKVYNRNNGSEKDHEEGEDRKRE